MATPVDSQSLLPPTSSKDIVVAEPTSSASSQGNSVKLNLLPRTNVVNTEYLYFCGNVSHSAIMKCFTLLTFFICAVYVIQLFVSISIEEMRDNLPFNAVILVVCSVLMYQATFGVRSYKLNVRKRSKYASVLLMFVNFLDGLDFFYNWYNSYSMIGRFILIHIFYMGFYVLCELWCQELIEQ